jgi:hypothetical protein
VTFADRLARPVVAGLLWLAAFSVLYTVGDEVGAWPELPPGAFRNVDRIAGFFAGIAVLLLLALPKRAARADTRRRTASFG